VGKKSVFFGKKSDFVGKYPIFPQKIYTIDFFFQVSSSWGIFLLKNSSDDLENLSEKLKNCIIEFNE
jgi:hypothetical protein